MDKSSVVSSALGVIAGMTVATGSILYAQTLVAGTPGNLRMLIEEAPGARTLENFGSERAIPAYGLPWQSQPDNFIDIDDIRRTNGFVSMEGRYYDTSYPSLERPIRYIDENRFNIWDMIGANDGVLVAGTPTSMINAKDIGLHGAAFRADPRYVRPDRTFDSQELQLFRLYETPAARQYVVDSIVRAMRTDHPGNVKRYASLEHGFRDLVCRVSEDPRQATDTALQLVIDVMEALEDSRTLSEYLDDAATGYCSTYTG